MSDTKVVTGKVRFSYLQVFKAKAMNEDATAKFSTAILIPKTDKVTLERINKAVEAAKLVGKSKYWNGKIPGLLKTPLRDGDLEKPDDENYAGMMFLNANSIKRPGVVDADRQEILNEDEFFSGCYGRVSINFYPFKGASNGIAAGLGNVQMLEVGERLGAEITSPEEDFGDDSMF